MDTNEYNKIVEEAMLLYKKAGIVITDKEMGNLEVSDFGLGDIYKTGIEVNIYVNTDRVCAKEIALLPGQICPEHRHPAFGNYIGKEETFRCRYGTVYLYVEGERTPNPKGRVPEEDAEYYNAWHEIILRSGDMYTLQPNTLHWFQGCKETGAVVSEFSTPSYDEQDIFTNPRTERLHKLI